MIRVDGRGSDVHQPNQHLREARRRIPSRQTPGVCLSRQEVADLVNEWVFTRIGRRVEVDDNYIGKLERGVIRWPNKLYRQALRTVLRVESDAQLGFHARYRASATVDDVDRQQFFRLAGTVMALPWLELFTPPAPTPVPAKIDLAEIEHVRSATAAFRSWDNTHGGGRARETVFAQVRWSAQLLHADCPEKLRAHLFTAVAQLGGVAGYMAFDAYAHDDARRAFHFSLQCAEQAGNWHLRAHMLNMMARQANWIGRPDDALTYVETALVRRDRLTATERASLRTQQARALAKLGRVQETLAMVGAADDEFAHTKPTDDPHWMNFYDHAQHHSDTGQALFDLAIAGRKTESARRLTYAIAHHGVPYARSRAMTQIKLASLLMATSDPNRAAAIGRSALSSTAGLRSQRASDDLRVLHDLAGPRVAVSEVAELRDRITEALRSAGQAP